MSSTNATIPPIALPPQIGGTADSLYTFCISIKINPHLLQCIGTQTRPLRYQHSPHKHKCFRVVRSRNLITLRTLDISDPLQLSELLDLLELLGLLELRELLELLEVLNLLELLDLL